MILEKEACGLARELLYSTDGVVNVAHTLVLGTVQSMVLEMFERTWLT